MSQFDSYSQSTYVDNLRSFLRLKKQGFVVASGLIPADLTGGRPKSYPTEVVAEIEAMVNEKAALAESPATTFATRYQIARDYKGYSDAEIAKHVGVSREWARRWGLGMNLPTGRMQEIASLLSVPVAWLEHGQVSTLPADSHIGVRVGEEASVAREELFAMTLKLVSEIPESATEDEFRAIIEKNVFAVPRMSQLSRRAGGRWQLAGGGLLFSPWVPLPARELTRRSWSDEVETIILEELDSSPSVYGAWQNLKRRCEALGIKDYPKLITLHKRIEKSRDRINKYGIDLNELVKDSLKKVSESQYSGVLTDPPDTKT